jgi:predicted RNA methylase
MIMLRNFGKRILLIAQMTESEENRYRVVKSRYGNFVKSLYPLNSKTEEKLNNFKNGNVNPNVLTALNSLSEEIASGYFLEIGSGFGFTAMVAMSNFAGIILIEPDQQCFQILQQNIALNLKKENPQKYLLLNGAVVRNELVYNPDYQLTVPIGESFGNENAIISPGKGISVQKHSLTSLFLSEDALIPKEIASKISMIHFDFNGDEDQLFNEEFESFINFLKETKQDRKFLPELMITMSFATKIQHENLRITKLVETLDQLGYKAFFNLVYQLFKVTSTPLSKFYLSTSLFIQLHKNPIGKIQILCKSTNTPQ